MGLTLPQAANYGQRPSLRTNRLDRPGTGSQEAAAALTIAADEFSAVLQQNEAKADALNYSLARNEMLQADLAERDKLADDRDWKSHDERYSTGFKKAREAIGYKYDLDPRDRAVLGSETNLIAARGRIAVGANSKKLEIEWGLGELNRGLAEARESIINADQGTRNELVLGQQDAIEAARQKGYLNDVEAEALRQKATQDYTVASLDAMPAGERRALLEASQAYRRGYGIKDGKYTSLIRSASEQYGIPANLIAAQMAKESGGDPNAKSGAFGDPTGLMQLGEAAASDMGVTDRTDPKQSIDGGTRYLSELEERFAGDRAKALAAYNWGKGNVLEAFDKHGDDWLANAPEETRNYVNKLLPVWEGSADVSKSMTATNSGIGPLTADDIREGKGTGSIADFLHSDTLAAMLDKANKEDKENLDRIAAQNALDRAADIFPEDHAARLKYIKDNLSGRAREYAETNAEQFNNSQIAIKARANAETMDNALKGIDESTKEAPFSKDMIPADEWADLSYGEQQLVEATIEAKLRGTRHADPGDSHITSRDDGLMSLRDWENLPTYSPEGELGPYFTPSKENVDLESWAWAGALDETMQSNLMAIQESHRINKKAPIDSGGPNLNQLVESTLQSQLYGGEKDVTKRNAMTETLKIELQRRVTEMQDSFTPRRKLLPHELQKIWGEMATMTGTSGYYDWTARNVVERFIDMTPKEMEAAAEPLAAAKVTEMQAGTYGEGLGRITIPEGGEVSQFNYLVMLQRKLLGKAEGDMNTPENEQNVSRAYWALINGFSTEEIERRLKGG